MVAASLWCLPVISGQLPISSLSLASLSMWMSSSSLSAPSEAPPGPLPVGAARADQSLSDYIKHVVKRIDESWRTYQVTEQMSATVRVQIAANGDLQKAELVESNGDRDSINSALESVRYATPFGEPPISRPSLTIPVLIRTTGVQLLEKRSASSVKSTRAGRPPGSGPGPAIGRAGANSASSRAGANSATSRAGANSTASRVGANSTTSRVGANSKASAEPKPALPIAIMKRLKDSTVLITILSPSGGGDESGLGFVVAPHTVVTNLPMMSSTVSKRQVAARVASDPAVHIVDGIVVRDRQTDLIVLRFPTLTAPPLPLAASSESKPGSRVYLAGTPESMESTSTQAAIADFIKGRDGKDFVRMSARLAPELTGGPVLNEAGRLVGISVSPPDEREPVTYALPAEYISRLLGR